MRSNLDNALLRKVIFETAAFAKIEKLALTADFTMIDGFQAGSPLALAFDLTNTNRQLITYVPTVTSMQIEHEVFNISAGTGILTVKDPTNAIVLGTIGPGQRGDIVWIPSLAAWSLFVRTTLGNQTVGAQVTLSQYTTLAALANTNNIAQTVPFAFKLNSIGFRVRVPATTAAKLATLQAQIQGVACTGGAVSLTSANATPTKALVAGTAITALNVGAAGNTVEALISGVTAFLEGDGVVEWNLTNTSLLA